MQPIFSMLHLQQCLHDSWHVAKFWTSWKLYSIIAIITILYCVTQATPTVPSLEMQIYNASNRHRTHISYIPVQQTLLGETAYNILNLQALAMVA